MSSEEASVLGKTIDSLTDLPHKEIDEGQRASDHEFVGAEAGNNGFDGCHSLFDAFVAVLVGEGHASNATEVVSDDVLEHEDLAFLSDGLAEEFRSEFFTKIESDCLGLSQLDVSIDDIWQVGEVENTAGLEGGPGFSGVLQVLEVDSLQVEDVTVDATARASPDGPVSVDES